MLENGNVSPTSVLAYATPTPRRARPVLGICVGSLGIAVGVLGIYLLFFVIHASSVVFTKYHGGKDDDVMHNAIGLIMSLPTAVFCIWVAFERCKAAFGIMTGRSSSAEIHNV